MASRKRTVEFGKAYRDLSRKYVFPDPGKRSSFLTFNNLTAFIPLTPLTPPKRNKPSYLMASHEASHTRPGGKDMIS